MQRDKIRTALIVLATSALTVAPLAGSASGESAAVAQELAKVRRATALYHDIDRALADGFSEASPCVPGMGVHYVRSIAADQSQLEPTAPNILVYAPRPDGSLRLVAVEYASWSAAALFGVPFAPPGGGGPPFHTLHAWVWQGNPDGMFVATNPNIDCPD